MKDKYHKESGLVLNYCEIKIDKTTKKVSLVQKEKKVIISNDKSYVVESEYGSLQVVNKIYSKYASDEAVNKVSTYKREWGSKYLDDCIISKSISTFTKKVTYNRVKKKLFEFLTKESYFYHDIINEIKLQLKQWKEQ